MKHQKCTALILSALFAAGCLAGCGAMYDTSDVEDPAGVGTSAILGQAGTETLKRIYQDALADSGLQAGADQRVQDALNQALNRRTAVEGREVAFARTLRDALRRAGIDAAVYSDLPSLLAAKEETACCVVLLRTAASESGLDAVTMSEVLQQMSAAQTADTACQVYLSVEDGQDGRAVYAVVLVRT